jgi:hypothetical protein
VAGNGDVGAITFKHKILFHHRRLSLVLIFLHIIIIIIIIIISGSSTINWKYRIT